MNPLLVGQIQRIRATIRDLAGAVDAANQQLAHLEEERDAARRDYWEASTRLNALHRMAEDYESLEARYDDLKRRNREVRERLLEVLKLTRALGREFHE